MESITSTSFLFFGTLTIVFLGSVALFLAINSDSDSISKVAWMAFKCLVVLSALGLMLTISSVYWTKFRQLSG